MLEGGTGLLAKFFLQTLTRLEFMLLFGKFPAAHKLPPGLNGTKKSFGNWLDVYGTEEQQNRIERQIYQEGAGQTFAIVAFAGIEQSMAKYKWGVEGRGNRNVYSLLDGTVTPLDALQVEGRRHRIFPYPPNGHDALAGLGFTLAPLLRFEVDHPKFLEDVDIAEFDATFSLDASAHRYMLQHCNGMADMQNMHYHFFGHQGYTSDRYPNNCYHSVFNALSGKHTSFYLNLRPAQNNRFHEGARVETDGLVPGSLKLHELARDEMIRQDGLGLPTVVDVLDNLGYTINWMGFSEQLKNPNPKRVELNRDEGDLTQMGTCVHRARRDVDDGLVFTGGDVPLLFPDTEILDSIAW